jgi:hypothetical protein
MGMSLEPAEPGILVLDNGLTRGDVVALQTLAVNHVDVVTLPPHSTHIMQPVGVSWAGAFSTECGWDFRQQLLIGALERACTPLPVAPSRGRSVAGDSWVTIPFATIDAAGSATSTS